MDLENYSYIQVNDVDLKRILAMVEVSTRCMYNSRERNTSSSISKYPRKNPVKLMIHSKIVKNGEYDLSKDTVFGNQGASRRVYKKKSTKKSQESNSDDETHIPYIMNIPPPRYITNISLPSPPSPSLVPVFPNDLILDSDLYREISENDIFKL